ncbi:hypothetical protein MHU86_12787 [Fragilaria crotonensis]|nr:hypothetical protein MHU86_12787 [Fragilaria crotonensis]
MDNIDQPWFDGSADDAGKDSSGGDGEKKAPATWTTDDLTKVVIKKDDSAEEYAPELPNMSLSSAPSGFSPHASSTSIMPTSMWNDSDDHELTPSSGRYRLEHASPVEPPRPPGHRSVLSWSSPQVEFSNNRGVVPGAFAAAPSHITATSETFGVPRMGSHDSWRELANEESKQEETDIGAPGIDLYAVEARLAQEEATMIAEAKYVKIKWYQRPLYRWISVGSVLLTCVLLGAVIVLFVVLFRPSASATTSSASLSPTTPATPTTTDSPSLAPVSESHTVTRSAPPSTVPPSWTPEQVACTFLSISNVAKCRTTVKFDLINNGGTPTGSTIPSEVGLLTQMRFVSFSYNHLSGNIPSEIGLLTQLTELGFSVNELTSTIPTEIGLLTQLTKLEISHNMLTSTIPSEIGRLTQLTYLALDTNQLISIIPTEIGRLSRLSWLSLSSNQLSGTVPSSLCSHANTIYINCGEITCQSGCCSDESAKSCA